jgi:hypothetical protein
LVRHRNPSYFALHAVDRIRLATNVSVLLEAAVNGSTICLLDVLLHYAGRYLFRRGGGVGA